MSRPAPQIPGYYYGIIPCYSIEFDVNTNLDTEKKKYFKIQPNHTAPSSAAYSASDVKRRKTRDEAAAAQHALQSRQKGRIRRSTVLEDPLLGGSLGRCQGRRATLDTTQIFGSGLIPQGALPSMNQFGPCSDPFFDVQYRDDLPGGLVDVRMGKSKRVLITKNVEEIFQAPT